MNNITHDNLDINNIIIGNKFHLIFENQIFCEAQIFNISEDCFSISIFTGQANYKPISINDKIKLIIVNRSTAFNCSSEVIECSSEDGFQLAVLTIPTIINKIERRIHARVELAMPAYYLNLPSFTKYSYIHEVPNTYFDEMKKTFTVDISNNGIKLITHTDKNYSKDAIISLDIGEKIDILASAVRTDFDKINNIYKTAFEFKDIDKHKWQILKDFLIKN